MIKQIVNKRSIIIVSIVLMIMGLGCGILGSAMANNNIENLKTSKPDPWYQSVHVNDKNQFGIYIQAGPLTLMKFGY